MAIIEYQKTRVVMLHRPTPEGELRLVPFKSLANPFLSVNKQSRAVASYFYPYKVARLFRILPHMEENARELDGENGLEIDFNHDDSDGYSTDPWLKASSPDTLSTHRGYGVRTAMGMADLESWEDVYYWCLKEWEVEELWMTSTFATLQRFLHVSVDEPNEELVYKAVHSK
ncbi:hypothetical protein DL763_009127 [Monosporascus cannonballus]|nr:hypothetical protein DL763_009127 [Monosporascus cannonballus]